MHHSKLRRWSLRRIVIVSGFAATGAAILALSIASTASEASLPQYQRKLAAEHACKAAAAEISSLRMQLPIKFVDDCVTPKVTPVSDQPGYVIVTRIAEEQISRNTARRKIYAALMDGRSTDAWRMLQVQSAPTDQHS